MAHARYLARHGDMQRELHRTADLIANKLIGRVRDRHWRISRDGFRVTAGGDHGFSTFLAKSYRDALIHELHSRLAPHVAAWGTLAWRVYGRTETEQHFPRTCCLTFFPREDRVDWFACMYIEPPGTDPLEPPPQSTLQTLRNCMARALRRSATPFRSCYDTSIWH